jgi:N-carbamoylputrescine amidase
VNAGNKRLNEAFVWHQEYGYCGAHEKRYLPDEEGFWEASWYDRGAGDFSPIDVGQARIGFMICTELWFMQHAREYGQDGMHLLAVPRATPAYSSDKWLAGGRAAAVVSGAFCLSANRASIEQGWGGTGWIMGPDGDVLAKTTADQPFVTVEIDLNEAELAKKSYPRYVIE